MAAPITPRTAIRKQICEINAQKRRESRMVYDLSSQVHEIAKLAKAKGDQEQHSRVAPLAQNVEILRVTGRQRDVAYAEIIDNLNWEYVRIGGDIQLLVQELFGPESSATKTGFIEMLQNMEVVQEVVRSAK